MNGNTYTPKPEDGSKTVIPEEIGALVEYIAQHNHDVWAVRRFAEGYTYGETKDEEKKKNPYLKSYFDLEDKDKLADINSAESVIKFILSRGYNITGAKLYFPKAEYRCWERYYGDKKQPIYKAPLILGVVGQEYSDDGKTGMREAADKIITDLFDRIGMKNQKKGISNSERKTPVFVLSALASNSEKDLAQYLSDEYNIQTIHVVGTGEHTTVNNALEIQADGDKDEFITRSSFMLISLWDGVDRQCRTGVIVRNALLETDPVAERSGLSAEDTVISETHPVYQIVVPSAGKKEFAWLTRLLLPYTLDSGCDWYTLNRAVIVNKGKKSARLVDDSEEAIESKRIENDCSRDVAAIRSSYRKMIREAKADKDKLPKQKRNEVKKLQKNCKKAVAKCIHRKKYYIAIEKFKKNRFNQNIRMIKYINANLARGIKYGDKNEAYDLLQGSGKNIHGVSLSADAVNMRHLRLDTVATAQQKFHRIISICIAIFAGLGLSSYGVFSDLASSHSLLGVIGGVVSSLGILIALVLFGYSRISDNHGAHVSMRLLSEGLRVKTFWNAAGIYDKGVEDCLTERQRIDLEWAQNIFRGWDVTDRAFGFYESDSGVRKGSDALLDELKLLWLGAADQPKNDATKYSPYSDGQLAFARKRGNEFGPEAEKNAKNKMIVSAIVVILTFAVTVWAAFNYLTNTAAILPASWAELTADSFTGSELGAIFETALVFLIGIVPSIAACALMYKETKMCAENAKRYKWMAVKYQKLISCMDRSAARDEKLMILEQAGKIAVEEIAEWTALVSESDINLPF